LVLAESFTLSIIGSVDFGHSRLLEVMATKFETELTVLPRDIDVNGHVHHSVYLDYLLAARFDHADGEISEDGLHLVCPEESAGENI